MKRRPVLVAGGRRFPRHQKAENEVICVRLRTWILVSQRRAVRIAVGCSKRKMSKELAEGLSLATSAQRRGFDARRPRMKQGAMIGRLNVDWDAKGAGLATQAVGNKATQVR